MKNTPKHSKTPIPYPKIASVMDAKPAEKNQNAKELAKNNSNNKKK